MTSCIKKYKELINSKDDCYIDFYNLLTTNKIIPENTIKLRSKLDIFESLEKNIKEEPVFISDYVEIVKNKTIPNISVSKPILKQPNYILCQLKPFGFMPRGFMKRSYAINQPTVFVEELPAVIEEPPAVIEEILLVIEELPAVIEETQSIVEDTQPIEEETPSDIDETPSDIDERPSDIEETSPVAEETSPVAEETSPVADETPSVAKKTASITEEESPIAEETSPIVEETPSDIDETPSDIDEAPSDIDEALSDIDEAPSDIEKLQPVAEETQPVAEEVISLLKDMVLFIETSIRQEIALFEEEIKPSIQLVIPQEPISYSIAESSIKNYYQTGLYTGGVELIRYKRYRVNNSINFR